MYLSHSILIFCSKKERRKNERKELKPTECNIVHIPSQTPTIKIRGYALILGVLNPEEAGKSWIGLGGFPFSTMLERDQLKRSRMLSR